MATGSAAVGCRFAEARAEGPSRACRIEPLESRTVLSAIGLLPRCFTASDCLPIRRRGWSRQSPRRGSMRLPPTRNCPRCSREWTRRSRVVLSTWQVLSLVGQSPASSQSSAPVEHVATPPAWTLPGGTDVPDNSVLGSAASDEAGSEPAGATLGLPPASAPTASPTEGGFVILVYVSPQQSYQPEGDPLR